jgi:hypothetical protein
MWLHTNMAQGKRSPLRESPEPRIICGVRWSAADHQAVRQAAFDRGVSMNTFITEAAREKVARQAETEPEQAASA